MRTDLVRQFRRQRRKRGIRRRIFGSPQRPRLTVYRSLKHIYAQVVDDLDGRTLASADTRQMKLPGGGNCAAAAAVGTVLAEKAKAVGVGQVALDRNGFRYHGRLKALADAAREGGLKF